MIGWPRVRVNLKGINSVRKRLADGSRITYWYAWKGGPPLRGQPGTPEFVASYNDAVARKVTTATRVMSHLLRQYQSSDDFRRLADRTRADYLKHLAAIETEFHDFPLAALSDRRTR